jgi:hypothetical protein
MGWIKHDDGGNGTGWYDPSTVSFTKSASQVREANATALWHVAKSDSRTIMDYLEIVCGWDMTIPLKSMTPEDRAFCESVAAWDGIDILHRFFCDNKLSLQERIQVIEYLKTVETVQEACSLFLASKTTKSAPVPTPVAATTATKSVSIDYEAAYEANIGVNLREKAENGSWYMDEVYPLSLNDWAAQQLGYALPNVEEVEAVSF